MTECSCNRCVSFCNNQPCMPKPEDILKVLIHDQQFGTHFALGFEITNVYGFDMIRPRRTRVAGPCVFLTVDNKCQLHAPQLKPYEGREVDCSTDDDTSRKIHNRCAAEWKVIGAQVIQWYKNAVNPMNDELREHLENYNRERTSN